MNDSSSKPSAMKRDWSLTQEALDQLLLRLDDDPKQAQKKYEEIRRKLINYFEFHGGSPPDALADKTIDRVAGKIVDGTDIQTLEAFAMGAAWRIVQEYWRSNETKTISIEDLSQNQPLVAPSPEKKMIDAENERQEKMRLNCMRECFNDLPPDESELMLQYQMGEKSKRSKNRVKLAKKLGITRLALRLQVHQIRIRLRACVEQCVRRNPAT